MCAKIQEFLNCSEEYLTGRLTTGNIEEAQLLEVHILRFTLIAVDPRLAT